MSAVIDGRMAERRRTVAEAKARRRLGWTVTMLVGVVLAGIIYWLLQSPLLALERVDVSGAEQSHPAELLETAGVIPGVPTVSVRAGQVQDALERDPWIARAKVEVQWPDAVAVTIIEHEPVGWVRGARNWLLVSATGAVLQIADSAPSGMPSADVAPINASIGDQLDEAAVFGFIDFVGALSPSVVGSLVITGDGAELFATIPGHRIRLGSPVDMGAKAATLSALLDSGLETGSSIDLISPIRPAVVPANPESLDDPGEEPITQSQVEGEP